MTAEHEPAAGWPTHVLAAALLLAGALWAMRAILPAPASTFVIPPGASNAWEIIGKQDQKLSAANVAWSAHRFLTAPWKLYDAGQCYPSPNPATLGPHQLGEGLLGALPFALTGDPVITFNTVLVLELWIAGLAMYALVFELGGSAAAAFVAALLFALHPKRILDVAHPDVHGNHWMPLALLFAHRLFVYGGWRDALGLATFLGLQLLGNIYQVLTLAVLGGTYGVFLAVAHLRRLPALAPKIAVVLGATGVVAWLVLGPYLHTLATWGNVGGRVTLLNALGDFTSGHAFYPGSVLLALAALGLADRWRGRRQRLGYDPRIAILVAGLMTVWASVMSVPLPGLDVQVPSLFTLAGRVLRGLDAIRAGAVIGFGATLAGAVLAGYGVLVLVERCGPLMRTLIAAGFAVTILFEVFRPEAATSSFGRTVDLEPYADVLRPSCSTSTRTAPTVRSSTYRWASIRDDSARWRMRCSSPRFTSTRSARATTRSNCPRTRTSSSWPNGSPPTRAPSTRSMRWDSVRSSSTDCASAAKGTTAGSRPRPAD